MATLRSGDFDKAASALGGVRAALAQAAATTDSARFWLGNALYGQKNYKEAINVFRAMVTAAPTHPRTPEALLAIANCQIEMKDMRGPHARRWTTWSSRTRPAKPLRRPRNASAP